jgi:flavin-dependent thymidylate synthase
MKVTLINYTQLAAETLIFSKQTRLNMTPDQWQKVCLMSDEDKAKELQYMANTIPSSWEFVDYIFLIQGVSRAFTHQFVRHRHGSYAQQTMRVLDVSGFEYVTGPSIGGLDTETGKVYHSMMASIDLHYRDLIKNGAEIEDARGILPTNICTNILAKLNLRSISELAKTRTGGRTQIEYRQVMAEIVNCVLNVHPWAKDFMFPRGVGFFDELEEFARRLTGEIRTDLLKIIDKMRKRND